MNPRPLVMRCGAFGDMVLLTTLLRQLEARFGQPVDVISSGPWTRPLIEGQPAVGEIFLLESRKSPYWLSPGQRALVRWLRARGAGPTWYCDPGPGRDLLRRGGISDDLVCDVRALTPVSGEHYVERWIRFANETPPGLKTAPPPVRPIGGRAATLAVAPAARAALTQWLASRGLADRDLILIQAGNKRTMRGFSRRRATNTKYWPEASWGEVARGLRAARPRDAILLLGVPAEHALNEDIAREAAVSDVHNLANDLPVARVLPLFERAHSLISVDTGPAHAAAALGCPTVALFGLSDPALYRPGGVDTPAIVLTGEVNGERNILGIEPWSVLDAWRELTTNRDVEAARTGSA